MKFLGVIFLFIEYQHFNSAHRISLAQALHKTFFKKYKKHGLEPQIVTGTKQDM